MTPRAKRAGPGMLKAIAVFKLFKAVILLAAGVGALRLLDPVRANRVKHWISALAGNYDTPAVHRALGAITGLTPSRIGALGIGALIYAALFTVEGVGLWMAKRWAEYLTIIATASLMPFELYELIRRVTPLRLVALGANAAIVVYLVLRVRRKE
jgi:uncharacterized membrane protein (DUF2068 family)